MLIDAYGAFTMKRYEDREDLKQTVKGVTLISFMKDKSKARPLQQPIYSQPGHSRAYQSTHDSRS